MKKIIVLILGVIAFACMTVFCIDGIAVNADTSVYTVEKIIETGAVYDGYGSTANEIKESNGVLASSGAGKLVVNAEISSVSLNVRFLSGGSVFFVLRASDDKACWDGGHGYFAMVNKKSGGVQVQLIEGAETGNSFVPLDCSSSSIAVNLFDGEKHLVEFSSADEDGKVKLSFSIDGGTPVTAESKENVYPVRGSHFFMAHGQGTSVTTYKLYTQNGFDISPAEGTVDYATVTSKTLLKNTGSWTLEGAKLTANEKIDGNRDSSIALFSRELSNVV